MRTTFFKTNKMKKAFLLLIFVVQITGTSAQTNKTFFLGHSLVNFHIPNMVNKLSVAGAQTFSYNANIGNGANLLYHWTNPASGQGAQWDISLPQGGYENFIVTEAIPLLGQLQWSNTYRIADSLYRFAKLHNPGIQYYLYETWHCNTTGTPAGCEWDNDDALLWRPRLTADLPKWEGIADSINLIHPEGMLIIPGGQALARLYDSIMANGVPGITSINQLFLDDIHLTNIGNYFIACLMYGVIHKESPVGLPAQLTDEWGVPYAVYPTNAQALVLQQIAWETLCAYPRDGVSCTPLSVSGVSLPVSDNYTISPNPANDRIVIKSLAPIDAIEIFNITGVKVYARSNLQQISPEINVSAMNKGIYFIKIHKGQCVATQKIILE